MDYGNFRKSEKNWKIATMKLKLKLKTTDNNCSFQFGHFFSLDLRFFLLDLNVSFEI